MGPFCNKKRVQDSFYKETLPFPNSCFSQADRKSSTRGRGQRTPTQRGSGENKPGRSRILLSNFPGSQEKREITTYNRSVQTEFLSEHSVFQNGNGKQSQAIDSTQGLGIFTGFNRCLSPCTYSLAVSEIPPLLYQGSDIPIQGSTLRSSHESVCLHTLDGYHSNSSAAEITIVLFPYLDDWLVRNQIRADILRDQQFTIKLISSLGLIINEKKSDLIPAQNFVFIGMEFLTHKNIVRVPWDRVQDILSLVLWFKKQEQVSARLFLSLLGKLSAAAQFVVLGRLHLRPLQMALFAQWKPHVLPLEHCILINMQIKSHLEWWNSRERFAQGVLLKPPLPSHTLFTDASLSGWGAHLKPEGLLFHGVWSLDQSALHINVLEMKAIPLALKQCHQHVNNTTVMIATDNSSVVAYLRKQGGTHSPSLCMEVWETLRWCDKRNINLLVRHVPGKSNILADRLSRLSKPISTEWCLDQAVCNLVLSVTGYPNIDLFATRLNNRLPVYVSPIPDDRALAIDALSMNWDRIHAYAFPPFALIPAIISKIRQHQCKIVLVAPFWPEASWFPELLWLLVAPPIRLPVKQHLLTQLQFVRNNIENLRLHVWILCANQSEIEAFRRKLPNTPLKLDEFLLEKSMISNGTFSPVGVVSGRLIQSWHLQET